MLVSYGDWQCERHGLGLSREDLVVGVDQLNPNLVLADRQTGDVDRVVAITPPLNSAFYRSDLNAARISLTKSSGCS